MSGFDPTPAQAEAIRTRGGAVLVSAGAGSGKTRVLTERLMGYLTDPEHPAELDSFLIITFTKAAAGELRSRIMEELAAAQAADPGNRRLRRQSALCRRAQIGTIHSFCASLLREFSAQCGLTPDFAVADEDRAQTMKAAALERTLEERYERADRYPGFLFLADTVGVGRDDRRLAELVLELHGKMQSHARPEKWARETVTALREEQSDAGRTPWGQALLADARESAAGWSRELDQLTEAMADYEKLRKAYLPSVSATAEALRGLLRSLDQGWDWARACLPVPFPRLGSLRNLQGEEAALAQRVKTLREACKKETERLAELFRAPSAELLEDLRSTAPAMEALLELTLAFDREYARDKRRAGLVDYADLEHMAAQLLTGEDGSPTELAGQIARRYTEIMVDEYQDVSQVQDEIFRAVSREGKNLFLVGDVKQSIYRFRLADPSLFTEKYERYAPQAAPGQPRRIDLRENFRSRREILEAANRVFSLCMSRALGDVDYDDAASLVCGAPYAESVPAPELLLLAAPRGAVEERPDRTAQEAALVAEKIRELMAAGTQVTGPEGPRPLGYGDIALLLRSANTVGPVYRRELQRLGIPVASGQSGGFFRSLEVSTVLSMLSVIDDPHQDIPLIAVLRSPAFGFEPDRLSAIRACHPQGDFYSALVERAKEDGACRDFLALLDALRAAAPDLSAAELVWRLLEQLELPALCAAMDGGELRKARLYALAELAGQFEATGYRGLHRFVLWLGQLAQKGREPSLGAETAQGVQIFSIHKAKGLEFPVVFLCDTGRRFNTSDSRAKVLVHPELGLGPKVTDLQRRQEYPTLARSAIRLRLDRETLSEELRLLYVAMTRPKERLFITATLHDPDKALEKAAAELSEPMPPALLARAAAPVNWLLYAALAGGEGTLKLRLCPPPGQAAAEPAVPAGARADPALTAELERNLAFRYPNAGAEALPSKVTATELKGHAEPDADARSLRPPEKRPFRTPDFGRAGRPLSGAERGIATHLLLQVMDFGKTGTLEEIQGEIQRLRALRFLSDREAEAVDARAVWRLFRSPLGRRILAAKELHREFRFSLLWDAAELYGTCPGEKLLLQGVVDCFFEEEGELVVVDYKTDFLSSPQAAEEKARFYAGQLRAYARALERILQKPVKECALYFLSAGLAVPVPVKNP